MTLRHFLERSQEAAPATGDKDAPWLLLIDHHEARIFRTEVGAPAFQRILPHKPEDFFRHAHNSKDFSRGREKPDPNSFFEPVAKALQAAGKILVLGSGKGSGSEMEQFVAWVKLHHPELGKRITGSLVVDEHHLSDGQLMASNPRCLRHRPNAVGAHVPALRSVARVAGEDCKSTRCR